jgi:AbrB family looped-hinge helix DNA binding protein
MYTSRLTQKYQATIPRGVRDLLDLHEGDLVGFEVTDHVITLRKISPLDLEFAKALEGTLTEWNSDDDDKLYKNL